MCPARCAFALVILSHSLSSTKALLPQYASIGCNGVWGYSHGWGVCAAHIVWKVAEIKGFMTLVDLTLPEGRLNVSDGLTAVRVCQ